MLKRYAALGAALAFLAGGVALAQVTLPTNTVINSGDLFQDIVNGTPVAGNQYVSALTLAGYVGGLPTKGNVLIGGDATTNLWQRATSGASQTTTQAYGGPDRWFYWSGTSTAVTVSRDSTAGDLSNGYQYAFKMARTSGQTGVVQTCMAQEVESANTYQFAGQTAELHFNAFTGANYSPTSANMTAYIITGTGTDEGASKLAFGLNAGGGGSTGWAGQANATAAVISLGGVSTAGRYAAVGTIPAGATEIAVALCFTPVGTAGANDYIAFEGIGLVRNASLAGSVSATAGYACSTASGGNGTPGVECSAFDRSRSLAFETALQQRYFYKILEGAAVTSRGLCAMSTSSIANCLINFPVQMRIAPVFTGDGGFVTGFAASATTASSSVTACTSLAVSATLASTVASPNNVIIDCASSAGFGAAGTAGFLWDNNTGTPGQIKASAEL